MSDYDIHSCGYYCDQSACIERQRNELRDKLFEEIRTSERNIQTSDKETLESLQPWVKTYSGGKPNYTQPIEKEWVGLTDEDKNQIAKEAYNKVELTAWELAQRVGEFTEVKLKEKNGF